MKYSLGAVKPHVRQAAEYFGTKHGIKVVYGWGLRAGPSEHPLGLALDYMTMDKAKGDGLVADLIANGEQAGVTYIIWWRRIWQNGQWRPYTRSNPHTDHVHVSFKPGHESKLGTPTQPAAPGVTPVSVPGVPDSLSNLFSTLSNERTWLRAAWFAIGFSLALYALIGWSTVKEGVKQIAKS